jgi:putative tricarboxylic transport membrane protein
MSTTMSRDRIILALLILAFTVCILFISHSAAQTFPTKPVEFIVHTTPGGGTDVFARAVAEFINRDRLLTQSVIVSNRTGGSGTVAFSYVKGKRGDPHVVLTVATGTLLTAASRSDVELGLDNYTPLAFFALDPQVIAVSADSKIATFKDLVDIGKRQPNTLVDGVASAGGSGRQVLYLIERATGAKYKFVAFKSGAEAAMAVLGNHVGFTTENLSEMFPQVAAKKMRVLAVTGEKRLPAVPEVPTLKELGYPVVFGTGRGFAMPAGVPKEAAAAMEAVLKRVHDSAAWKEFSSRNMYEDTFMGSAEFAQFLAQRRGEMHDFLMSIGLTQKP